MNIIMANIEKKNEVFLTEFIELYRNHPCLWKVKSKEYMDKHKKQAAYEVLIQKMREIDDSAVKDTVVKKINNLRSSFRKELKKVKSSTHSGMDEADRYVPHLWYYNLLTFLTDQEMHRSGLSSIEEDDDNENTQFFHSQESQEADYDPLSPASVTTSHDTPSTSASSYTGKNRKRGSKKIDPSEAILDVVSKRLAMYRDEDEFDILGKNIANKLRKVSHEQKIIAEKIISDVLYEAELGTLHRNSGLVVNGTTALCNNVVTTPLATFHYNDPVATPSSEQNSTFGQWRQPTAARYLHNFDPNI